MFRIRAVESPTNGNGLRTVWHRGAKNAELVSEIDEAGRVARHEFSLFDEVLIWERGRGFSSGQAREEGSTRGSANFEVDHALEPKRVTRMVTALQSYDGGDRIIEHLRKLVLAYDAETHPVEDLGQVTGNTRIPDELLAAAQREPPRLRMAVPLIVFGVVLIVIGVLVLALK
ncbi:MAG: hypothetical protein ACO1OB_02080 [Archangium sp.]